MTIDVVIPTYNRLWSLRRVLPFYLGRAEVGRVVVVDDCTTDGTASWLAAQAAREPRLVVLRHTENRGASGARNTGADTAKAPLVFFADDDMLFTPPDGLVQLARELDNRSADIAVPIHIFPEFRVPAVLPAIADDGSNWRPLLFDPATLELRPRKELARVAFPAAFESPLACGVMMMRRDVLDHIRYDERLGMTSYRDETDFQLKALRAGRRLIACSRPVLLDLAPPQDGGGCHAATSLIEYEWHAIRNNWTLLVSHRDVIRAKMGIRAPLVYLQARFIADHADRLARRYLLRFLRRIGLVRATP